jgi:proteasome beta subunit
VIPLFVGYEEASGGGRIFGYDVAGGPSEETRFHSIGSGSIFAKSALKKYYYDDMSVQDAVLACVQALYDAADDDSATGGPDLTRRIFPVIATITGDGFRLRAAGRGRPDALARRPERPPPGRELSFRAKSAQPGMTPGNDLDL